MKLYDVTTEVMTAAGNWIFDHPRVLVPAASEETALAVAVWSELNKGK